MSRKANFIFQKKSVCGIHTIHLIDSFHFIPPLIPRQIHYDAIIWEVWVLIFSIHIRKEFVEIVVTANEVANFITWWCETFHTLYREPPQYHV